MWHMETLHMHLRFGLGPRRVVTIVTSLYRDKESGCPWPTVHPFHVSARAYRTLWAKPAAQPERCRSRRMPSTRATFRGVHREPGSTHQGGGEWRGSGRNFTWSSWPISRRRWRVVDAVRKARAAALEAPAGHPRRKLLDGRPRKYPVLPTTSQPSTTHRTDGKKKENDPVRCGVVVPTCHWKGLALF